MSHEGKAVLATVGTVAAVVGGLYEIGRALPATPEEVAKKEAKQFPLDVALGKAANVLENGVATVERQNKGKYDRITNPVITKSGHVIGRNKLTGNVEVYYLDAAVDSSTKHITFAENGKTISQDQARKDAKPLVLETPQRVGHSSEYAYVAAPGQGFTEPIAVDVPEHTVTIERIVPDTKS